jgi:hypothetical protein
MMEPSPSSSAQPSMKDVETPQHASNVQVFALTEEHTVRKRSFYSRWRNAFARKLPRLYRAAVYLRGPRPKRELEG